MKKIWKFLYHFFPIQLLFLHFRRSLLLLVFWLLLFAMAGGYMFQKIGIPYLFEMPEYLGDVNFFVLLHHGAHHGVVCDVFSHC